MTLEELIDDDLISQINEIECVLGQVLQLSSEADLAGYYDKKIVTEDLTLD